MDKADTRPYQTRLPEFRAELIKLCKKYRIEILATIAPMPSAIVAQLRYIDMNDVQMLARYGLTDAPKKEENKDSNEPPSLLTN